MLSLQKPNRAVIIVTKNIDALVVKYNITEPKFKFIYIRALSSYIGIRIEIIVP